MPTLLESTLHAVSLDERATAGDTIGLTSGLPYLHGVEVVGHDHPRPFWKVCRDLLGQDERKDYEHSLWTAGRFQLTSAQLFASRVKNADALKERKRSKSPTYKSASESPDIATVAPSSVPVITLPAERETKDSTTQNPSEEKTVEVPPNKNQVNASSESTSFWPSWFMKSKTIENKESAPRKSAEGKESEVRQKLSQDLENLWSESFPELDGKPSTVSTTVERSGSTPLVTEGVTETPVTQEPTTSLNLGITDASLSFFKEGQDSAYNQSDVNSPSQVYVDQENRSSDKTDEVIPSPELKMNMQDLPEYTGSPLTVKPTERSNGTVYRLPNISMPVEPATGEVVTIATPPEGDVTLVVSASPVDSISRPAEQFDKPTTVSVTVTQRPNETIDAAHSNPSVAPNSNTGKSCNRDVRISSQDQGVNFNSMLPGTTRRRKDVSVQAFEVPVS